MATSLQVMEGGGHPPYFFDRNKSGLFYPAALRKSTQGSVLYKSWIIWGYVPPEKVGKRKHCAIPWESKS